MEDLKVAVIILIVVISYSFINKNFLKSQSSNTYSIPPEYMGQEGLNYIKLCISAVSGKKSLYESV
jgi:hypothetical protein